MIATTSRVAIVTGASRGIGAAVAQRLAADGLRVVINYSGDAAPAAELVKQLEANGQRALAVRADVSDREAVSALFDAAEAEFGGIDVLVNNASAIWLRGTLDTPMKRFDLMQQVNARGTFLCSQVCLPLLLQAANPHILTLAPPPSLDPKWWAPHAGYTLAKMGMSFVTIGLAGEFGPRGVAVNALWPRTLIATDALKMIPGISAANARTPQIMADAAHAIVTRPARGFAGRFLIDDDVLREAGVTDFSHYAVDPGSSLLPDLFID